MTIDRNHPHEITSSDRSDNRMKYNHHHRDVAFFKGNVFWTLSDTCMLITDESRAVLEILLFLFAVFLLTFLQFLRCPSFRYFHPLKNFMVLRAEQMQGPQKIPSKNGRRQNVTMSIKELRTPGKTKREIYPTLHGVFQTEKSSNSSFKCRVLGEVDMSSFPGP